MMRKIYFLTTLIGILILTLFSQMQNYQTGIIDSIQKSETRTIITLKENSIKLIVFDTENLNLTENETIKFKGKIENYKNEKQIIVDTIEKLE